jgi:hypothetical protein
VSAGHPTVGTGHLLVHLGVVAFVNGEARLVLGEGVGPVRVGGHAVRMGEGAMHVHDTKD